MQPSSFHAIATRRSLPAGAFLALALAAVSPCAAQQPEAEAGSHDLTVASIPETLFEPRRDAPTGGSGAPRQGWLGVGDGFFTREVHLAYDYAGGGGVDRHTGLARFNHPLSQRLWVGVEAPFLVVSDGETHFGDISVTEQIMLHETRDVSINLGNTLRLPTGDEDADGGLWGWSPTINAWSDVGSAFSLRGTLGYRLTEGGRDALVAAVAIGQTLTSADAAPLGEFTWYVSAGLEAPDDGDATLSVLPGLRSRLSGSTFALAGVEIPVVNSGDTFDARAVFQIVQGF